MCLKTFGRFRTNIEVVSASRIKVYEYIKCVPTYIRAIEKRTQDSIFPSYFLASLLLLKKCTFVPHFLRKVDIFFNCKMPRFYKLIFAIKIP